MNAPSIDYTRNEKMNIITNIKNMIYPDYRTDMNEICNEIISSIPNSSIVGINKDHNGIILSFNCNSSNVTKYDIEDITIKILRDYIIQKCGYNFSVMDFLSSDENVKTLFRVMFIKCMSFSIII